MVRISEHSTHDDKGRPSIARIRLIIGGRISEHSTHDDKGRPSIARIRLIIGGENK